MLPLSGAAAARARAAAAAAWVRWLGWCCLPPHPAPLWCFRSRARSMLLLAPPSGTVLWPREIDRGAPAAQSRRLPAAVLPSAVLGRRACCSPRAWVALSAGRAGPCVIAHRPGAIEPRSGYSRRDVRSSCVREKTCGDGFTRKDWSAHGLRLRRLESGPAPNPGGAAAPHPPAPRYRWLGPACGVLR